MHNTNIPSSLHLSPITDSSKHIHPPHAQNVYKEKCHLDKQVFLSKRGPFNEKSYAVVEIL